jgi:DNA-binding transcriptional regulator YdaS (Cro superfamily)
MRLIDRLRAVGMKASFVAEQLGITSGAVSQWDHVPAERVLEVERITGIPRHELRPDIYPPDRELNGGTA